MVELVQIDAKTYLAGQIQIADIEQIAATGIRLVVNNRPDGEAAQGQPATEDVAAAVQAHGMDFLDLPFTGETLAPEHVAAFAQLLQSEEGPILAYCRTGTRSSRLWAAANLALGAPQADILQKADMAGYDLRPVATFLDQLGTLGAQKL